MFVFNLGINYIP